jgi:uncharacterized protein
MTMGQQRQRLASIHIYPMKAARGVDLEQSVVEPWGLAGDRRWLLVDQDGRCVTQREEPSLARVTITYDTALRGPISVSANRANRANRTDRANRAAGAAGAAGPPPPACRIAPPALDCGAELVQATVWDSVVPAASAGPAAAAWFSAYLGRPVRLVYLDDPTRRPVDPEYGRNGDTVSFADGYPLLLTTSGSLDGLNRWLTEAGDQPVPMTRFRPSVVVTGVPPWAEDRWRRIRIGAVPFRVAKPCGRCVVTTTDQLTGERSGQPLKMLGRHRNFNQELVFGQNLIPDAPGVIRVGDPLEILE